eukprot:m.224126 g.224126  ORF g.224126 m.224126 type:complete len:322 (-) comp26358_c0_seq4:1251-2216(-)
MWVVQKPTWLVCLITIVTGCVNVLSYETIIKQVRGAGDLITLAQFIFITIEGFFGFYLTHQRTSVPLWEYALLATGFLLSSIFVNLAPGYGIPMPFLIVFRSAGLVCTMVVSMILLNKSYPRLKILAVIVMSAGVCACAFISNKKSSDDASYESQSIGIGLLVAGQILGTLLGIRQEVLRDRYQDISSKESLFFLHLFSLPAFLVITRNINQHVTEFSASAPWSIPVFGDIPYLWPVLIANILFQYMCISHVFVLTTSVSSLTLNFVLTLRKFCSLVISVFWFNNPFLISHWFGALAVFTGSFFFVYADHKPKNEEKAKEE